MLSPRGIFVVGTDTEVGKSFHAAGLARQLAGRMPIGVYKPVASGGHAPGKSDAEILRTAAKLDCPIERVCPQQFLAPVAPPVAAKLQIQEVDEKLMFEGAEWWYERCEYLIIEGAGGVLSPLSWNLTVLDVAERLGFPVALVALNRLGMVNHTLLSVEAIERRGLTLEAIVLNTLPQTNTESAVDRSVATNRDLLSRFIGSNIPILDALADLVVME